MMSSSLEFTAVCFGPGLLPGGQRVTARITVPELLVSVVPERDESVAWPQLRVTSGGFDHQQMLLSWTRGEEQWSLMPVDAAARELLVAHAPPEMHAALAQWNKSVARTRRGFHFGWAALGALVASPLLLVLIFWWQSERVVGWVVDRISPQTEQELGKLIFAQVEASTPLIKDGPALDAIRDIGTRLTAGSKYSYHWYIAKDAQVNAFAMPGGYVVVNAGLIQAADTAEEVAGVLAHEVQHVERRHSLKGMVQNLGWSVAVNLALGQVGADAWAGMATQLGGLKFGRDYETEADVLGLAALTKAHIDAHGMLRFFEKLQQQDGTTITLLSTHPATADRLAALKKAVSEQGAGSIQPLPYDWAAIKLEVKGR
ncbi:MAG: M48 family metallopeptidase [Gammaproteobacteria bacterium]|nr:M48 family metallopeptidase [Gammaproteobacteria bacterium]